MKPFYPSNRSTFQIQLVPLPLNSYRYVAGALNAEKEERVAEDEQIVHAINDYTRALQDGLRIVNQS